MKFSEFLKNIDYVNIYPMISLVIFTVIFLIVLLYAFTADQKKMDDNANIPLK
ncbi:MAG: CcoQ/FixQ family Cbb3-type cytochrome c oxidase assembly chaperone [Weeksellaceae bacterium]